jgi:SAM-dependent methyltransferase
MADLLLGCGSSRIRRVNIGNRNWSDLTTCDFNTDHRPDVVHDLRLTPYPWGDDAFDEVHCYETLEHLGAQGDAPAFFAQCSEIWRILRPGGLFCGTCPSWKSMWAWGDPSHSRVITSGTLIFLDQNVYAEQVGKTTISDFRNIYRADFERVHVQEDDKTLVFVLRAVKPSRWKAPA